MANLRDLAARLAPPRERTPVPAYRQAVVEAVSAGPPASISVRIGGEGVVIPGVRYAHTLAPAAGQTVWVLVLGKDMMATHRLA